MILLLIKCGKNYVILFGFSKLSVSNLPTNTLYLLTRYEFVSSNTVKSSSIEKLKIQVPNSDQ